MPIQGILTGGTQPQGGGGLFAGLGDKVRARENYDKKKNTIVRSALKKGKSWEDISKETGLDVAEVKSLSEAIDPNYGIKKPKSLVTTAKDNVKKNISSALDFGGAVESVIQDVTGGTARKEKLLEDQQKLISLRKKEIERSGVLSPETKKKLIGELTAQQRGIFAKATAERSNQLGELNRTLENPVIRGGAAFGAGVKRSGEGVAQGVGGIYDLATPGKGQSRLTQAATRSAEGSDKFVQDNQLSDVAYKGGQLTGEALQLLTGTKAIKAMASLPGASKLVAVAGKADELENLLRTVNKGGKAGDAAITAARHLLDPARVANVVGNTAVDQGQLSARGQDINAKTVGTSVGLNYALGGILDGASAGLTRRATNKANIAQDAATLADNARINDQMAGAGDLVPGQRQLTSGTSSATAVDQPTLTQDLPTTPGSTTVNNGVPRAAQRTEALAIENGLAESGFDLQPTAKMNMADQADKALNVINTDYEAAKRIALGEVDAPGDLRASVMYEAVKQQAVKDGDSALLYKLAKESSVPTAGKEAGQFIKGFDYKNPSDPTVAMKDILDARAKSKVKDIPKDLTPEEADTLTKMAQDVADKKAAILDGGDRLDYGESVVKMRRYKNDLIDDTKSFKEKNAPRGLVTATFGTLKSLKSSLDNSFFGRQGFKVLTTHPKAWGKAFVKSWGDIAMGISGKDALDVLDADILSRPNSINNIYKKMGLDVGAIEDAFPSSLPEKIPGFGRVFKASEYAYTGAAHRMRADLADQLLDKAERAGVDITDKKQLESLGKLINSMTGRGHLGKAEGGADTLNNLFFSARNWKSNFDTITAHQLQKDVSPFVRKEAAVNLLKMIAATSAVMTAASAWKPGSVEWDPRSSNFGKIKIGNTRFEMTGGMASIATVASRIATQETKSSTSDRITKLNSDEFGAKSTWDVLMDYAEGKMSPGAQVIKQVMTGKDFVGNAVTPASIAKDALMPLPVSNYQELKNDPKSANTVLSMIADGLGIGTNTYSANKDWNQVSTKRIQGFKKTVDAQTFATANNDFNEEYNRWFEDVRRNEKYKNISEDMRKTLINQKKQDLTDSILERYGYKYKQERKQSGDKQTLNELKDL